MKFPLESYLRLCSASKYVGWNMYRKQVDSMYIIGALISFSIG